MLTGWGVIVEFSGASPVAKDRVCGLGISLVDIDAAVEEICRWIAKREPGFVCVRDAHGVVRAAESPELLSAHEASALVVADGFPLVKILQWRGRKSVGRVRGADLFRRMCAESVSKGFRHFLFGGEDGVADQLAELLRLSYPGIEIVGTYTPPFRPLTPTEDQQVINRINNAAADIVWVGLSTPKQELWMAEHAGRLQAPAMIGVGAAFDFLLGRRREAPKWVQEAGLEWLHRSLGEPRRLGRRYAEVVPKFLWMLLMESLRRRDRRTSEALGAN